MKQRIYNLVANIGSFQRSNTGTFGKNRRDAGNENKIIKRQSSYENILDAPLNRRSEFFHRPRSVGTVPGKVSLQNSSNGSDPCLLSSLGHDIASISTEDTPGTDSLDSGITASQSQVLGQLDYSAYLISLLA